MSLMFDLSVHLERLLTAVTEPLLNAPKAIEEQISGLGRKVVHLARNDTRARFMTTPGIGPITALCYLATINDPARFRKSRNVGGLPWVDDTPLRIRRD